MKILIVSDTHGRDKNLEAALKKVGPIDRLIHLGDAEGTEKHIRTMTSAPVDMVAGNCDYFTDLPRESLIELGKYRAFLTHGNSYGVNAGVERLAEEARERGADIAMFGHTHCPHLEHQGNLTILNPGSLTQPRQNGWQPTFILMEIDREGTAHYNICDLRSFPHFF